MTTPEEPTQRAPHNPPPGQPLGPPPGQPLGPSGQPGQPGLPPQPSPYGAPGQWPQAGPPSPYPPAPGPYGQQPAPSPYATPSGSGKGGRTVAIVVGSILLVVVLICGGAIALVVAGVTSVKDAVDESISEFDAERPGGRDNPIEVEIGDEFEIDGITYASGWQVTAPETEYDGDSIGGLRGTNEREDESSESVFLSFTFIGADDVEIGEIRCSSDGTISYGNTEELECNGSRRVAGAERIEVSAAY